MRLLKLPRLSLLLTLAMLAACAGDMNDLDNFMADKLARPGGVIEPIPTFKAYEAFAYAATTMRSPFDRPVEVRKVASLGARAAIKPDPQRPREFLEQFTLDSLQLVGKLERGGQTWSLIKDPDGGIHRVQRGSFLGRDHGSVVDMGETFLSLVEIVSDGTTEGWVERPRTLELVSP